MKKVEEYVEMMGWFPSFKHPEKLEEDEEFVYYKFKIPHKYVEWRDLEYNKWTEDPPDLGNPHENDELVLGIIFLPVYKGVEFLGEDEKFLYYKCKIPKVFMETVSPTLGIPYSRMYEEEQLVEDVLPSAVSERRPPKTSAGSKMPRLEIELVEITLRCGNKECEVHRVPYKEITSDIFKSLYNVCCGVCGCKKMEVIRCEVVTTEVESE